MRHWLEMLGGLIVWAVHFLGVYVIASIGEVVAQADDPLWRLAGFSFSVVCAVAATLLWARTMRRHADGDEMDSLVRTVGGAGAALALVSIVWQTLPTVIA